MSTDHNHATAMQSPQAHQEYARVRADDTHSPELQSARRDSVSSLAEFIAQSPISQAEEMEESEPLNIIHDGGVFENETVPGISPLVPAPGTPGSNSSVTVILDEVSETKPRWRPEFRSWFTFIPLPKMKRRSFEAENRTGIKERWRSHRYLSMWWWETTCCVIALAALVAIAVTIRAHEHKPLPQWRYGLTVNAMIAAYTVTLKAAAGLVLAEGISHLKWIAVARPQSLSTFVAHDNASRGPLGALSLLWKNEYRAGRLHMSPVISSLGALITVMVLLVDPFSQQIIKTYQCERRVAGENGTIARTNLYAEVGSHSGAGEATITLSTRNAVNNGLFASHKPEVDSTCRTGNCTFADEYTSLAFCSSCSDATDELEFVQYEEELGSSFGYDMSSNNSSTNATDDDFQGFFDQKMPYTNVTLAINDRRTLTLTRGGQAMSAGYNGLVSDFVDELTMIRWDGRASTPFKNQTIRGYRCRIYPCLKTFRAKITTGRIEEEELSESMDDIFTSVPSDLLTTADLNCLDSQDQRKTLQRLGYQFNETTRWLPYNVSWVNGTVDNPTFVASHYPGQDPCQKAPANQHPDLSDGNRTSATAIRTIPARCIYSIGRTTSYSLKTNLFSNMFTGFVRSSGVYGFPGFQGTESLTALFNVGSGNGTLDDVQRTMKNMTNGLTTYMRNRRFRSFSEPAVGEMYEYTSCIQVRWAWLSYAAIIVGSLLVFFMCMVVHSRNDQSRLRRQWKDENEDSVPLIHDFKSSVLDLLYHGMDQQTLREMVAIGATNQTRELEKSAENVKVTLVATEQGWKLSSVAS